MLFQDHLLDADRAPLRPLGAWMSELASQCDDARGSSNQFRAKIQNNHALIALHVSGIEVAMRLCSRQIEWSFRMSAPDLAMQPSINHLRLHRIAGDREALRNRLDAIEEMILSGIGRLEGGSPFELSRESLELCAANYVKEVFQLAVMEGGEPTPHDLSRCERIADVHDVAALVYAEAQSIAACRSGDRDRFDRIDRSDRFERGNYPRAVLAFYRAAFACKWLTASRETEAILARLVELIAAASDRPMVDHRLLRFATAISRLARHAALTDVARTVGTVIGRLAHDLDDVPHQVYHCNEVTGNAAEARRIARASGYRRVGPIEPDRDDDLQARLGAEFRTLHHAVTRVTQLHPNV